MSKKEIKTTHSLCPKCKKGVPLLTLEDDQKFISIQCECSNLETMSIKQFLSFYKTTKVFATSKRSICKRHNKPFEKYCLHCHTSTCAKDPCNPDHSVFIFKDALCIGNVKDKVSQVKKYIEEDLPRIKAKYISELEEEIQKINEAYEKSISMNKDILSFIDIITENYFDRNYNMYKNVINNCNDIRVKKYITEKNNYSDFIKYMETFSIINPKETSVKVVKEIKKQRKNVIALLSLRDGRLASSSEDYSINIYNPKKNFHCDVTIKVNSPAMSMCQLENGDIVTTNEYSREIHIWEISEHSYKLVFTIPNKPDTVQVIPISHGRFATRTRIDIFIWKGTRKYTEIPLIELLSHLDITETTVLDDPFEYYSFIEVLHDDPCEYYSFIEVPSKDLLISSESRSRITIWSTNTYQLLSTITDVDCFSEGGLCLLSDKKVLVEGDYCCYVINIETGVIEYSIDNEDNWTKGVMLGDNTIVCGNKDSMFTLNVVSHNIMQIPLLMSTKKKSGSIRDIIKLNDDTVACSIGSTIYCFTI